MVDSDDESFSPGGDVMVASPTIKTRASRGSDSPLAYLPGWTENLGDMHPSNRHNADAAPAAASAALADDLSFASAELDSVKDGSDSPSGSGSDAPSGDGMGGAPFPMPMKTIHIIDPLTKGFIKDKFFPVAYEVAAYVQRGFDKSFADMAVFSFPISPDMFDGGLAAHLFPYGPTARICTDGGSSPLMYDDHILCIDGRLVEGGTGRGQWESILADSHEVERGARWSEVMVVRPHADPDTDWLVSELMESCPDSLRKKMNRCYNKSLFTMGILFPNHTPPPGSINAGFVDEVTAQRGSSKEPNAKRQLLLDADATADASKKPKGSATSNNRRKEPSPAQRQLVFDADASKSTTSSNNASENEDTAAPDLLDIVDFVERSLRDTENRRSIAAELAQHLGKQRVGEFIALLTDGGDPFPLSSLDGDLLPATLTFLNAQDCLSLGIAYGLRGDDSFKIWRALAASRDPGMAAKMKSATALYSDIAAELVDVENCDGWRRLFSCLAQAESSDELYPDGCFSINGPGRAHERYVKIIERGQFLWQMIRRAMAEGHREGSALVNAIKDELYLIGLLLERYRPGGERDRGDLDFYVPPPLGEDVYRWNHVSGLSGSYRHTSVVTRNGRISRRQMFAVLEEIGCLPGDQTTLCKVSAQYLSHNGCYPIGEEPARQQSVDELVFTDQGEIAQFKILARNRHSPTGTIAVKTSVANSSRDTTVSFQGGAQKPLHIAVHWTYKGQTSDKYAIGTESIDHIVGNTRDARLCHLRRANATTQAKNRDGIYGRNQMRPQEHKPALRRDFLASLAALEARPGLSEDVVIQLMIAFPFALFGN